jgi:hypothetical protein
MATTRVEVEVARLAQEKLILSYTMFGNLHDIAIPPVLATERSEDLWQHTCFEAFLRSSSGLGYYEFNFSPSRQWAAYRFRSYRRDRSVAAEVANPIIRLRSGPDRYTLQAELQLNRLSKLRNDGLWRLALSAVIEGLNGLKSYWALKHPPGKPDFHHPTSFVHKLDPTSPS